MTDTGVIIGVSGSIAGCYVAIIGVYRWVSCHVNEKKKHPCSDDLVFQDVCDARGETNDQAHDHLTKAIDDAVIRSADQHKEMKSDVKAGFTEIKQLIQNLSTIFLFVLLAGCAQYEKETIYYDGSADYIKINTFMKDYDLKALTSTSNKFKAIGAPGIIETQD